METLVIITFIVAALIPATLLTIYLVKLYKMENKETTAADIRKDNLKFIKENGFVDHGTSFDDKKVYEVHLDLGFK